VLLFNHGEGEYKVKEGERVAQLVLERVGCPPALLAGNVEGIFAVGMEK
jgi:dUTPase